ncbi:hypothetical protein GI582_06605 [Sulfitobacter sp. BDSS02]|nr:hypothetical protein [Sulfitobacter sp. BDSS02]MBR9849134.1 hypothetical protein [Paracoccaceae bacterium]
MKKSMIVGTILALGLAAPAVAAPVQWKAAEGGNDHWYEVVWNKNSYGWGQNISWTGANAKATSSTHNGMSGYLATITSAAEQMFLNALNAAFTASSPAHSGTYVTAWLGATDRDSEGNWIWENGEAFTYSNWASGEPNNYWNEDYLMGWYSGDKWNDGWNSASLQKYVVEYDAPPISNVPVPASLPLAAAGFGVFGLIARRRRKAA